MASNTSEVCNMDNRTPEKPRHRGIYLIPNLFTIAAMFAGFYAIIAGINGHFQEAAIAIFVAMLMDSLDGRIARLTHTQSDFGAQLDSLSDMICFGMTPAMVIYSWSLFSLGKAGWLVAFLYAVSTALRLARFNTQPMDKRYFQGLPTPAAAGLIASFVWVATTYGINGEAIAIPLVITAILLALLKVSTIRYRSFKDVDLRHHVPFVMILAVVFVIVLISFDPPDVLLFVTLAFVISGPVGTLWRLKKHD